jgi:hypothetical protein
MNNIYKSFQNVGLQQHMQGHREHDVQQAQDKQRAMEQYEKLRHDSYSTQGSGNSAPPTSPIRAALETLDIRTSNLMAVTERLFEKLRPVTRNTDDNHPAEPCVAREGNSSLSIDINAMADRIGAIEINLQLQIDRLEV